MEIESKREGSALTSAEFNQIPDELENVISKAGLTPTKSSLTQVSQSISQMVGDASFYATSGTANDIILSAISPRLAPAKLTNGMMVRFQALYENTEATSVNVGNLGAKTITIDGEPIDGGKLKVGKIYILTYVSSSDSFELFESGGGSGGLEIGDIGIAPLGIDENQNKRRYLNGQLIMQVQFESFTAKLRKAIELHPTLGCTEEQWQATALLTVSGQVGKFVIDDEQGTIRLPKIIMPIQGLTDLSKLAEIVEAGLPNITGKYNLIVNNTSETGIWNASGAFYKGSNENVGSSGSNSSGGTLRFDASRSNTTYGNSNTVQQEQIQYPYFIQVATGTEESVDVARDIVLNNPFFFGMYQWFEIEPNNASWLRSSDEFHEKKIYTDYYDWLLRIYNGTETQEGVSVKLHTEAYTDYDWVINREEETFRLPLKVKQAFFYSQNIPVVYDNPESINQLIRNGDNTLQSSNGSADTIGLYGDGSRWGSGVFAQELSNNNFQRAFFDPNGTLKVFLSEAENKDLKLYFYVGVVNQDAPLINSGRALEILPKKLDKEQLYNKITNCILEAPMPYFSITGTNITLKKGLRVLMPNGRNSDGTLKNLEFTLNKDITSGLVTGSNIRPRVVFIQANGMMAVTKECVFYLHSLGELPETLPNTLQTHAYCELENKWFLSRTGTTTAQWEEWLECPIMEYQPRSDGQTPSTLTFSTLDILKRFDKFEISGWGMPSNRYIDLTLGASGTTYTAPVNGWFYFTVKSSASSNFLSVQNQSVGIHTQGWTHRANADLQHFVPAIKGQKVAIYYESANTAGYGRFIYAEGEV